MNKALHVFVYLTLVVAGVALFFELNLFDKRTLLGDRNRMMEDYIVRFARTIEKEDAKKPGTPPEAKKDVSSVEAKLVDNPEMEDLLEGYPAQREQQNLDTLNWDNAKDRLQLRQLYFLGPDGQPVPDAANYNKPMTKGQGTMSELLDQLFERAKKQQENLNMTRAALAEERQKLETLVADYNKLKPEMRQDKVTIEELKAKIAALEQEKTKLEEDVAKKKSQIDELTTEVASLKDEVSSAKDETEAVKEDLQKAEKKIEQLTTLLQQQAQQQSTSSSHGSAVTSLPAGDKGKIADVNNKLMFCVVEFSDEAIKQLLGEKRDNPLPQLELGVRRSNHKGPAGEFVGRIRLRQAVADKNFVIADILGDWKQSDIEKNDHVYAE